MTPVETLTQIRAQADKVADTKYPYITADWLRTVLDAVSVDATPAQGIDRVNLNPLASRLAAHDFDADDTEVICQDVAEWLGLDDQGYPEAGSDRVLALVRPVEGITLTPEDTALIAECLSHITTAPRGFYSREKQEHARALASRLEASS